MAKRSCIAALCAAAFVTLSVPGIATGATVTFAKAYSNVSGGTHFDLTPEDVQSTSDGGYIAQGLTESPSSTRPGVSWLLKLSSTGAPQWQRDLGCLSTPPGDYADGVSTVQTPDGGYAVGGGTVGCGSATNCPALSGIQCALVEKVSSTGSLLWARVYNAGAGGSAIRKLRNTSDGGFVVTGVINPSSSTITGLVLKLDSRGDVQWQRELGPGGSTFVLLNDIRQTSDGGYVVTGQLQTPAAGSKVSAAVLVIRLSATGNVLWQRSFNSFDSSGAPTASNDANSVIQTLDGGFLVGGFWTDSFQSGQCCAGALALKLSATGSVQWQRAYSGGLYCFFNGFSETCSNLDATAYTVHQTADGGYVLTGDETLKLSDGTPIEPWMAKLDSSGNLIWQHLDYQTNKSTGRPLSEYFASSALASDGGVLGLGFTENVSTGLGELFGVKTDASGLAGSSCGDVHPGTVLNPLNPSLAGRNPGLSVASTLTPVGTSPATTLATSVTTQTDC